MTNKVVAPDEIAIDAWRIRMVYYNNEGEPEASRVPTEQELKTAIKQLGNEDDFPDDYEV